MSKGREVVLHSVQVNVHFCVWVGRFGWVGAREGGVGQGGRTSEKPWEGGIERVFGQHSLDEGFGRRCWPTAVMQPP